MSIWKPTRQGFFGPIRGETPGKGPRPSEVRNISFRVIRRRFSCARAGAAIAGLLLRRDAPPRDSSSDEKAWATTTRRRASSAGAQQGTGGRSKAARCTGGGGVEAQFLGGATHRLGFSC
uniref:Uncharacterized protein n=1 Tax=Oryza meridionalis TaxID=40149 RepID=A0A0E0CA61_9ORYZ